MPCLATPCRSKPIRARPRPLALPRHTLPVPATPRLAMPCRARWPCLAYPCPAYPSKAAPRPLALPCQAKPRRAKLHLTRPRLSHWPRLACPRRATPIRAPQSPTRPCLSRLCRAAPRHQISFTSNLSIRYRPYVGRKSPMPSSLPARVIISCKRDGERYSGS